MAVVVRPVGAEHGEFLVVLALFEEVGDAGVLADEGIGDAGVGEVGVDDQHPGAGDGQPSGHRERGGGGAGAGLGAGDDHQQGAGAGRGGLGADAQLVDDGSGSVRERFEGGGGALDAPAAGQEARRPLEHTDHRGAEGFLDRDRIEQTAARAGVGDHCGDTQQGAGEGSGDGQQRAVGSLGDGADGRGGDLVTRGGVGGELELGALGDQLGDLGVEVGDLLGDLGLQDAVAVGLGLDGQLGEAFECVGLLQREGLELGVDDEDQAVAALGDLGGSSLEELRGVAVGDLDGGVGVGGTGREGDDVAGGVGEHGQRLVDGLEWQAEALGDLEGEVVALDDRDLALDVAGGALTLGIEDIAGRRAHDERRRRRERIGSRCRDEQSRGEAEQRTQVHDPYVAPDRGDDE